MAMGWWFTLLWWHTRLSGWVLKIYNKYVNLSASGEQNITEHFWQEHFVYMWGGGEWKNTHLFTPLCNTDDLGKLNFLPCVNRVNMIEPHWSTLHHSDSVFNFDQGVYCSKVLQTRGQTKAKWILTLPTFPVTPYPEVFYSLTCGNHAIFWKSPLYLWQSPIHFWNTMFMF